MTAWLLRLLAPPMEPTCTPAEMAQASLHAARRIERYERERSERLAGYARNWPSADRIPAHGELVRFSRAWRP